MSTTRWSTIRWMRRTAAVAALGLVSVAAVADAQDMAQTRAVTFGLAGGLSMPTGDVGDSFKTGWNVMGSLGYQPAFRAVGARFDVGYHSLGADGAFDDLGILAGTGNVVLTVSNYPTAKLYVLGGAGLYNVDFADDSETKFGLNGGGGVQFRLGGLNPFIEARLHSIFTEDDNTNFIPLVFGLTF